jgi:hypothetical protein
VGDTPGCETDYCFVNISFYSSNYSSGKIGSSRNDFVSPNSCKYFGSIGEKRRYENNMQQYGGGVNSNINPTPTPTIYLNDSGRCVGLD